MSTWPELKQKVQRGLHVNNLFDLHKTCLLLLPQSEPNPELCLLLLGIFNDLCDLWYETPLNAQKTQEVEDMLLPAIFKAIDNLSSPESLTRLAKTYIQARKIALEAIC